MIITKAVKVVDNRIDVLCYDLSHNEYGTEHKHWIYSDQCDSKEAALKHIDDWVNRIQNYAELLKIQVKELEK